MNQEKRSVWEPPWTIEERLKFALVPLSLYMRYRTIKEVRRGEAEVVLLPFLADPAKASVDIGANKGVYTWLLRHRSREVHAFEPNPKMYRFLERLAGDNVHVSRIALSNKNGEAILRVPGNKQFGFSNQGASLSKVKVSDEYESITIDARRLDDLGITDVGFIKIDVEGFEKEVLDGARETIARDRPSLLIEMEEAHTGEPIEQAIERVESMGYRGMFLRRGMLRPIEAFDSDRNHRKATSRNDYVYNFIFLPSG